MTRDELERAVERTWRDGPDMVLCLDGAKRSFNDAFAIGAEIDFVLIRNDGWTLGCPADMLRTAHDTWPGDWDSIMVKPDPVPIPIRYFYDFLEDRITLQEFLDMTTPRRGVLH